MEAHFGKEKLKSERYPQVRILLESNELSNDWIVPWELFICN